MVDPQSVQRNVKQLLARFETPDASGQTDVAEQLAHIVSAAEDVLHVDCLGVMLLDESGVLRSVATTGSTAEALERLQEQSGAGPGVDTVRSGSTVVVEDVDSDATYGALLAQVDVDAVVSAPITVNGRVTGNLNAISFRAHQWTASEIVATETYAQLIATLLQFNASAVRAGLLGTDPASTPESSGPEIGDANRRQRP